MGIRNGVGVVCLLAVFAACSGKERVKGTDGHLVFDPGNGIFGAVALKQSAAMVLSVANVGRAPAQIVDVRVEGGAAKDFQLVSSSLLDHLLVAGQALPVRVHFKPQDVGLREATLVVVSDSSDPDLRETRIPLSGEGVDAQALLSQDVLDFGHIEVGSSRTIDVILENKATLPATLRVTMVGGDSDLFSFKAPHQLGPGEKGVLSVTFAPTRVGQAVAGLSLEPCEGCDAKAVLLKGEGLKSALVFEPDPLEMGGVAVDQKVEKKLILRNISDQPATVKELWLAPGSDESWALAPGAVPATLAPGQTVESTVRFTPTHLGETAGTVVAITASQHAPRVEGGLHGKGGGAEIAVTPDRIDFGDQPVGGRGGGTVRICNMGAQGTDKLTVTGISLSGDSQFKGTPPATPFDLGSGQCVDMPVFYEPTKTGQALGTVTVSSTDPGSPQMTVTLVGKAHPTQPCIAKISPVKVDFGTVIPGRSATLGFKVENAGADICAVKNLRIENDQKDDLFHLSGNVPAGVTLKPGEWMIRHVHFDGTSTPGRYTGAVKFEISNPAQPNVEIPIDVNVQFSCLSLNPKYVNWGFVQKNCPPPPVTIEVVNQCGNKDVTLGAIFLGNGTDPLDFEIVQKPFSPLTLHPGDRTQLTVGYKAQITGESLTPLYLNTDELPVGQLVPLLGETSYDEFTRDTFIQQDSRKIDVLFVIDNSESMVEEQPRLKAAIPGFIADARAMGVDMNIGVTTTGIQPNTGATKCPGGADGGENGRLFPADGTSPRILNLGMQNVEQALQQNTQVGTCHFFEQGLEAMKRALSSPLVDSNDDLRTPLPKDGNRGFFRTEAALALVFVSDEDDHSGADVKDYVKFLRTLKGVNQPQRVSAYAITPMSSCATSSDTASPRYSDLVTQTGGVQFDVCSSDFAPALKAVAQKAFAAQSVFNLSRHPDARGVRVFVNGTETTSGWSYDANQNAVVFDPKSQPTPGAKVMVMYTADCNHP